jgi:hypothetical protein
MHKIFVGNVGKKALQGYLLKDYAQSRISRLYSTNPTVSEIGIAGHELAEQK